MNINRAIGKLLVTGANGFVGMHLERMHSQGGLPEMDIIPAPPDWDIRDIQATKRLVSSVRPDSVLHLAAQSFVPRSFEKPQETFEINLMGTLNLLQALSVSKFEGRLLYVSTGDVYGLVPENQLPVNEALIPQPRNPYAASKMAAEHLCLQRYRSDQMDVVIARPFNHIGPGQNLRFVVPALAQQVAAIAQKRRPAFIEAGDIDVTRDFSDVRDVIHAYAAILQRGVPGAVYNISSGIECSVRSIFESFCQIADVRPELRVDVTKLRPTEQRRMVASADLLKQHTGWHSRYDLISTLRSIFFEHARNF
jgi:GDP-4-dehydro-6-deoxy-D-mannose reductase